MEEGPVRLALVGDLLVRRDQPESIFALAGRYLRDADIAFGNLEGPISDVGEAPDGRSQLSARYSSSESMVTAYTDAGIDVVSLANNHSMNRGRDGLLRTIDLLEQHGIGHAGAGRNLKEARHPAVLERNGVRVAFLAYTSVFLPAFAATDDRPGLATVRVRTAYEPDPRTMEVPGASPIVHAIPDLRDRELMEQDIRDARQKADCVVVSWHWGLSGATATGNRAGEVIDYQVELGHAAIDAGADLILGHHPHVLEGIEVYKDKAIFYSLGNFAFEVNGGRPVRPGSPTQRRGTTAIATCVVEIGSISEVAFLPFIINESAQPIPATRQEAETILAEINQNSRPFGTEFLQRGEAILISGAKAISKPANRI